MGKNFLHAGIAMVLSLGSIAEGLAFSPSPSPQPPTSSTIPTRSLQITSPSFNQNDVLPAQFTCDGAGKSPALRFSGVPRGTRSLVLIVVDPDAPSSKPDGRYLHWALWNLSASRTEIVEGQRALGLNENGPGDYLPPCPPNGEHRYVFQLYAIDSVIGSASISSEADLRRVMDGHVLEQSELVGRYTVQSFRRTRNLVMAIGVLLGLFVSYRVWLRIRSNLQPPSTRHRYTRSPSRPRHP